MHIEAYWPQSSSGYVCLLSECILKRYLSALINRQAGAFYFVEYQGFHSMMQAVYSSHDIISWISCKTLSTSMGLYWALCTDGVRNLVRILSIPDPAMMNRPSCREAAARALVVLSAVNKVAQVGSTGFFWRILKLQVGDIQILSGRMAWHKLRVSWYVLTNWACLERLLEYVRLELVVHLLSFKQEIVFKEIGRCTSRCDHNYWFHLGDMNFTFYAEQQLKCPRSKLKRGKATWVTYP